MEIIETMLMEILMDSDCHVVTNTEYSTEGIGTKAHVTILAHVLKTLSLFLHRVVAWAETVDFNLLALNL